MSFSMHSRAAFLSDALDAYMGTPVRENKNLYWNSWVQVGDTIFVDSLPDFERRLAWHYRPLPPDFPSAEPGVAIPADCPQPVE